MSAYHWALLSLSRPFVGQLDDDHAKWMTDDERITRGGAFKPWNVSGFVQECSLSYESKLDFVFASPFFDTPNCILDITRWHISSGCTWTELLVPSFTHFRSRFAFLRTNQTSTQRFSGRRLRCLVESIHYQPSIFHAFSNCRDGVAAMLVICSLPNSSGAVFL